LYPTDTVWELADATNAGGQDLQTETKSRNPKHDSLDEWRKMMYNVFKDIPEVVGKSSTYLKTQPL
jgi:hypothetical protein